MLSTAARECSRALRMPAAALGEITPALDAVVLRIKVDHDEPTTHRTCGNADVRTSHRAHHSRIVCASVVASLSPCFVCGCLPGELHFFPQSQR